MGKRPGMDRGMACAGGEMAAPLLTLPSPFVHSNRSENMAIVLRQHLEQLRGVLATMPPTQAQPRQLLMSMATMTSEGESADSSGKNESRNPSLPSMPGLSPMLSRGYSKEYTEAYRHLQAVKASTANQQPLIVSQPAPTSAQAPVMSFKPSASKAREPKVSNPNGIKKRRA